MNHLAAAINPLANFGVGVSLFGAVASDGYVVWSGVAVALVAVGLDGYRKWRTSKRAEDAADAADHIRMLELEVIRRVQFEDKANRLEVETQRNRHKIAEQEQVITFMRAEMEAIRKGVGKLGSQVKRIVTPDPDAPEPGTDEHATQK
jgi:hypothetical protein